MTRREIVEIGHPVPRERAGGHTRGLRSAEVHRQNDGMIETMRAADGAGLGANQVGETLRIAVAGVRQGNPRYPYKPSIPLTVIVDPVIEPPDAEIAQINEDCLSVADPRREVLRQVNIRFRYLDREGTAHEEVKRGLAAGRFQHELGHLDSTLLVDRVTDPSTLTTWAHFEWFRQGAFERARRLVKWVGS